MRDKLLELKRQSVAMLDEREAELSRLRASVAVEGDKAPAAEAAAANGGGGRGSTASEVAALRRQLREARSGAREAREALRVWRETDAGGLEHLKQVVCKYISMDETESEAVFQVIAALLGLSPQEHNELQKARARKMSKGSFLF